VTNESAVTARRFRVASLGSTAQLFHPSPPTMRQDDIKNLIPALDLMMEMGWVSAHGHTAAGVVVKYTPVGQKKLRVLWEMIAAINASESDRKALWEGFSTAAMLEFGGAFPEPEGAE
jgi:hypothetical protein